MASYRTFSDTIRLHAIYQSQSATPPHADRAASAAGTASVPGSARPCGGRDAPARVSLRVRRVRIAMSLRPFSSRPWPRLVRAISSVLRRIVPAPVLWRRASVPPLSSTLAIPSPALEQLAPERLLALLLQRRRARAPCAARRRQRARARSARGVRLISASCRHSCVRSPSPTPTLPLLLPRPATRPAALLALALALPLVPLVVARVSVMRPAAAVRAAAAATSIGVIGVVMMAVMRLPLALVALPSRGGAMAAASPPLLCARRLAIPIAIAISIPLVAMIAIPMSMPVSSLRLSRALLLLAVLLAPPFLLLAALLLDLQLGQLLRRPPLRLRPLRLERRQLAPRPDPLPCSRARADTSAGPARSTGVERDAVRARPRCRGRGAGEEARADARRAAVVRTREQRVGAWLEASVLCSCVRGRWVGSWVGACVRVGCMCACE